MQYIIKKNIPFLVGILFNLQNNCMLKSFYFATKLEWQRIANIFKIFQQFLKIFKV